ncbi:hypothetical protein C8R45DRAFT_402134 [Mycena sanguinolenta]|nr:hypothetical protein C8R45DRAFT_402134 [Mycena sanguinolenta]
MSVIVDDNDPLVQYSPPGGWSTSGVAPEFEVTAHASATPGDTATLVFEGISIGVYGSVAPSSGQSSLNFSIDGMDMGSFKAPPVPVAVHNQLFWTSPVFNEKQHTLVVTVNTSELRSLTLFLDYFVYITNSTAGQTLLIDDTDASVDYSPDGWQSFNSTDNCLESTQHVSTSIGSWATASFNGTGISLFGPPGQKGFSASIVVDGTQPVTSRSQTGLGENQLFNTSGLSPGPHTINVTILEGNLGIDYSIVSHAGSPAPATPQPASAPTGTPQSGSSKTTPLIVATVGGAIGGLIVLVLLSAVMIWQRRRRSARRNNIQPGVSVLPRWVRRDTDDPSITTPRPFQSSETTEPPPGVSVLPRRAGSDLDVAPRPFQSSETKEPPPGVSILPREGESDVGNLSIVALEPSELSATTEPPPPYTFFFFDLLSVNEWTSDLRAVIWAMGIKSEFRN